MMLLPNYETLLISFNYKTTEKELFIIIKFDSRRRHVRITKDYESCEGFNVTFDVTTFDGVYCDSEYVKNKLRGFLR